jgi:quinol monooxygenase YgiN
MIIVHGFVPVRAGHATLAVRLFAEIARCARGTAGCLRYDVFQSVEDTGLFLLQEWESMEALARHFRQASVERLADDLPALLDGEISTRRFEVGEDTATDQAPSPPRPPRVLH